MSAAPGRPDRANPFLVGATAIFLAGLVAGAAQVPLWKKPIFVGRPSLLVAARNHAVAGTLMMEDDRGIVLSTGTLRRIEKIDRAIGNRLSISIFAEFYRRAGEDLWKANRRAHAFGAAMMGVAVALFFVLAYRRLGYWRAVLAGLAWVTMPTYLAYLAPGHAEIPLLFLAVALLAVLGPEKPGAWHWLVAGVFTGLAAASKLTFAFYGPILLLWALFTRAGWKSVLAFVLPLPIAGLLYFGPDRLFSRDISENYPQVTGNFEAQEHPTFEQYGAVYPDPWTFRHSRREFDEKHVDAYNKYYGFTTRTVPWKDRMAIHALTVASYLEKTTEVRVFGGPIVVFGMLLGAALLLRIDRRLLGFLALTLAVTTALNIVTLDARGEHRIAEIGFVFAFPLGVALAAAVSALSRASGGGWKGALAGAALVLAFLAHQGAATRVAFSRIYSGAGQGDTLIEYVARTREKKIPPGEVVALGTGQQTIFPFNLYADVDAVAFSEGTVRKLLADGELDRAFEEYGVKWTLGYDPELAREIEDATGAESIAPRLSGGGEG